MKLLLRISLSISLFPLAVLPLQAATIVNGSFTGIAQVDTRPNGWSIPSQFTFIDSWSNSPDTWDNRAGTPHGPTIAWVGGQPTTSPDGGTFAALLGNDREGFPNPPAPPQPADPRWGEGITQRITDFIPGMTYTVSAYTSVAPMAQTGSTTQNQFTSLTSILELELYDPASPTVTTNNGGDHSTPLASVNFASTTTEPFAWGLQSVTFVAPAADMIFVLRNNYRGAQSSLLVDGVSIAQIPEPSAVGLAGLAGLALLRRRRP